MSAWMKLEASLRRLKRFRELGAAQEYVDKEIMLAKRHWAAVPLSPAGMSLVWPPDIHPLAKELGFDPDTRGAGPRDPELDRGIAIASARQRKAARIHEAIEAAGGITNLEVRDAGPVITLLGAARDDAAKARAAAIAQQLAPDVLGIENRLVIDASAFGGTGPAAAIHAAIEAAGGVTDLDIVVVGSVIMLTGLARDEATRARAAAIAKEVAPAGQVIENELAVDDEP